MTRASRLDKQHRKRKNISDHFLLYGKNVPTYVSCTKTSLLLHFRAAGTSFGQHCLGATRAALCSGHSEQHSLQQDGRMDMAVVQLAFILLSSNPRVVTPTAMHLNGSKLPNSCFQCCKLNLKSSPNQLQQVVQKEATPALAWSILMWGYYEEGNMAEEANCSLEYGAQK